MNVSIIWGAAGQERSTPVVDWLTATLTGAPQVEFHGGQIEAVLSESGVQVVGYSGVKG